MTALAVFCAATVLFLVPRDLFFAETRDVEVWLGFEVSGAAAWLTAPLHWAVFAAGAWGFWRARPWIVPCSAAYAFYVALSHLIWSEASPNGSGWPIGLLQASALSIPGVLLLRARRAGGAAGAAGAPAAPPRLQLDVLPGAFAVLRLDPGSGVPSWASASPFASVTRTPSELSVVCHESAVPASLPAERGLRCLGVRGPLAFDQTGVLESLARPLAEAGVGIFALSTYDTDYLLVAGASLGRAVEVLGEAGHAVHGWSAAGPGAGSWPATP